MASVQNQNVVRAPNAQVAAPANNNVGALASLRSMGGPIDKFFHGEEPVRTHQEPRTQREWQVSPRTRRALKFGFMLGGTAAVCYGAWLLVQNKQAVAAAKVRASHGDWAGEAATVYANCYGGDNGTTYNFAANNCAKINVSPVGAQPCDWKEMWFWEDNNIPAACTEQMAPQMEQVAVDAAKQGELKNYGLLTLLVLVPVTGMVLGSVAVAVTRCAHKVVLPNTQDDDIV